MLEYTIGVEVVVKKEKVAKVEKESSDSDFDGNIEAADGCEDICHDL